MRAACYSHDASIRNSDECSAFKLVFSDSRQTTADDTCGTLQHTAHSLLPRAGSAYLPQVLYFKLP